MTFGKDPRTYDMAARILNEEVEHGAWLVELLAHERDGKSIPSGHFRRGTPGDAPYSKNRGFYNPYGFDLKKRNALLRRAARFIFSSAGLLLSLRLGSELSNAARS